tara:strand:- start:130 stop:573 length:444 start_codon:yes stop_codon:yes gene_type:complete
MNFKRKILLLTIFLIIIFQTLLHTTNNQKTSFRYFKWTVQEISIGKLISISFYSGLFISTLLNTTVNIYKKNNFEDIKDNYESLNNQEDTKSKVEMPPQRDIREAQPTISVNYRVVKNMEGNNIESDQNYSDYPDSKDDWNDVDNEW